MSIADTDATLGTTPGEETGWTASLEPPTPDVAMTSDDATDDVTAIHGDVMMSCTDIDAKEDPMATDGITVNASTAGAGAGGGCARRPRWRVLHWDRSHRRH